MTNVVTTEFDFLVGTIYLGTDFTPIDVAFSTTATGVYIENAICTNCQGTGYDSTAMASAGTYVDSSNAFDTLSILHPALSGLGFTAVQATNTVCYAAVS
jgi:hypothetical protein